MRTASGADLPGELADTSGDAEIDAYCDRQRAALNQLFGVNPGLRFISGPDSRNAAASVDEIVPGHSDGCVLLGVELAREIWRDYRNNAHLPLAAVLAHEWGHILQFKEKFDLREGQWDVHVELSADAAAGWYLLQTQDDAVLKENVFALSGFFASLGTREFNNFKFHGSPAQRRLQFLEWAGLGHNEATSVDARRKQSVRTALGIDNWR